MKINKSSLLNSLIKVLPGVDTGNVTVEDADTVVFSKGHIYSYNSAISVDVEHEGLELEGVVKGNDFYNGLSKLPGDELDVEVTDKTWEIKDGSIKVSIKLLPQGNLLERFQGLAPTEDWIDIDGEDFNNALKTCTIQSNATNFGGVYFVNDTAISTNRCIINKYILKNEYPTFWISDKAVKEISKWNNFTKVQFNKSWVQFMSDDGIVFSVRGLNIENYPYDKVSGLISAQATQKSAFTLELNSQFYEALNRASEFSHNVDEYFVVDVEFGKEVKVESSRDSGNYEEVITDLSVDLPQPKKLSFDFKDFIASEKFFKTFKVLADGPDFSTDAPIHCMLENDCAIKIFSSIA